MIFINNVNDQRFELNGIQYFKNFQPHVVGESLRIIGVYDSVFVLVQAQKFNQFEVDGVVHTSIEDLQAALLPVLYTRGTLTSDGGGGIAMNQNNKIKRFFVLYETIEFPNMEQIVVLANNIPKYTIDETNNWVLIVMAKNQSAVVGQISEVKKFLIMNKGKGTYGKNGTPLSISDFEQIWHQALSVTDIENDPNAQIFDLGDIALLTISQAVNAKNPPIEINAPIVNVLFKTSVRNYLYTGAPGMFGFGLDQTTEADFNPFESETDAFVQIPQIKITTSTSITTATNDSNGRGQQGRNVVIDNGSNAINITVNGIEGFVASYMKNGSGIITFVQGAGRTLVQVDGVAKIDGVAGSTATISSVGTKDYLRISNAN